MKIDTGYKSLTQAEWQVSMLNQVAYIKPGSCEGENGYWAHAADGTPLAFFGNRDTAFATMRTHHLEPVHVN